MGTGAEDNGSDDVARAAWSRWLRLLSHDEDAALGASLAFADLAAHDRDTWLDALDRELMSADHAAYAYAPLLAVEEDPSRRARMLARLLRRAPASREPVVHVAGRVPYRAIVALSVYVPYVAVVGIVFDAQGVHEFVTEPLCHEEGIAERVASFVGQPSARWAFRDFVDELALSIIAHRRRGSPFPPGLADYSALFSVRDPSFALVPS